MTNQKVVLVTGASSGIGEATAERLAKAGYKVYGTSRRGTQAGKQSFDMIALDVTSDESVVAAVREVITLASVSPRVERKRVQSNRPSPSSIRTSSGSSG